MYASTYMAKRNDLQMYFLNWSDDDRNRDRKLELLKKKVLFLFVGTSVSVNINSPNVLFVKDVYLQ